ncbi:MAG: hypothetical protein ABI870_01225, partial [Rhodanobacter sp.]
FEVLISGVFNQLRGMITGYYKVDGDKIDSGRIDQDKVDNHAQEPIAPRSALVGEEPSHD